jgi:Fe-S-cluster-containing dehydrogenase component/formate-dependent nitrite reductase membrane component NrfD
MLSIIESGRSPATVLKRDNFVVTYGFVIDNRKCIGCHACTIACKAEHDVPIGVNRTWVKYIEKGEFPLTKRIFSVMRCNHCADAPCVEICPVTALYTRPDGIVDFDSRRCIGCKACTQACPYDAIYIDPDDQTAAKCNYCSHRVDVGLAPPCVTVCPTHAIISGNLEDPNSEISHLVSREAVQVRKPEKGTEPKLFYVEGDTVSLNPLAAGPTDSYMWSQGEALREPEEFPWPPASFGTTGAPSGGFPKKVTETLGRLTKRVYDPPRERVVWGWKVSGYILTKAIASGAFAIPLLFFGPGEVSGAMGWTAALLALLFLAATCLLLVQDLRRLDRFMYIFLRPQWKSWLVRGGFILLGFGLIVLLWLIGRLFSANSFLTFLTWPGIVLAFFTSVYTAFLLAQAKGRDFWQSPILSVHLLLHSILAGGAVLLICGEVLYPEMAEHLNDILLVALLLNFLSMMGELLFPHPTEDARVAAHAILKGYAAVPFWGGVIVLGHVLAAGLLFTGYAGLEVIASLLILSGLFLAAHLWVTIPQRIPLS